MGAGRGIYLRTYHRNPGFYNQNGRWAGAGLDPVDLASMPVGGLRNHPEHKLMKSLTEIPSLGYTQTN